MEKQNKYPRVDCTNDFIMVKEGLRQPKSYHIIFKKTKEDKDQIKRVKLAYNKAKKFHKPMFLEAQREILKSIVKHPLPNWGGFVFNQQVYS